MSVAGDDKAWQEFGELLSEEADRFEEAMAKHTERVAAWLRSMPMSEPEVAREEDSGGSSNG
jgi:hypothetical protein